MIGAEAIIKIGRHRSGQHSGELDWIYSYVEIQKLSDKDYNEVKKLLQRIWTRHV
jgi:hypothetical protein